MEKEKKVKNEKRTTWEEGCLLCFESTNKHKEMKKQKHYKRLERQELWKN